MTSLDAWRIAKPLLTSATAAVTAAGWRQASPPDASRPNCILVLMDDLGRQDLVLQRN